MMERVWGAGEWDLKQIIFLLSNILNQNIMEIYGSKCNRTTNVYTRKNTQNGMKKRDWG